MRNALLSIFMFCMMNSMKSETYDFAGFAHFSGEGLVGQSALAEHAIARSIEKLRGSSLAQGALARSRFHEAVAMQLTSGELVHLEDLVLLECGASQRCAEAALKDACEKFRVLRAADDDDPVLA